eukprot:gnl/MRDRNA2_/MRDRNA2_74825_c0_seq1.p1 gnl/MRDRNA2_/MRDRNA2_74825_c0~~gnl/MRDRNA2_/MRDRNA2_74825_c0_seq1.p1  ORF type:complete len:382 (-),score=85.35 gnl/MRDRNA2_/MRDRNA2_74825_c0_seq1:5-1150(-)
MMRACLFVSLLAFGAALRRLNLEEPEDVKYAALSGKPVFYQIVMGSFPFRRQYKLWMASLRQVGKYDGTVVFVTDKPGCIAQGLGAQLLGGNMTYSDKDVDIYPGTGKGQVHILKVKKPRSVRGIKMHKSKAWENIEKAKIEHPVSSIVYTDTDVVIGRDLRSFMAYENSMEKKQHTLALFPDMGTASWEGGAESIATGGMVGSLHTGVVVMFPNKHSQSCLKEWGQYLGGGSDDPAPIHHFQNGKPKTSFLETEEQSELEETSAGVDQQALHNARSCNQRGDGILRMSPTYLNLPDEKSMQIGKTAQFVHITNTQRWNQIKEPTKRRFFHKWLKIGEDIDYDKTAACPRDVWATAEYMERNGITEDSQVRALKVGKKAGI